MKFTTFVASPPGPDRQAFRAWFVDEYAPALVRGASTICGGVIRRAVHMPAGMDDAWRMEPGADFLDFDLVMETWFPSEEDFRREVLPLEDELRTRSGRYASYEIRPRLQKDPRICEAGQTGIRPEITLVLLATWASGVSAEDADRKWERHSPIALRQHPVLTKYEQNLVTRVISRSSDTPAIDAYADFSFQTIADIENGMKPSAEEFEDMSRFVARIFPLFLGDAEPIHA